MTIFFPAYVDQYNRKLHGDSKQLINDLYLTVIYKQVGDKTQKFLAKFEKPTRDEIQRMQNEALEGLEDISEQITEAMKPYGIQQLGIYYRDKRGVEIPAPDKKNVKNLLKSMNQTFLTKPLLSNATSLNLRRLTLIQKRWSSFISSQIWNGPSCLFAVIVSVSTSWTTALLAHCGGMLSRSER